MQAFPLSADLHFAVADHVGNRELGQMMPTFIRLAEQRIAAMLRMWEYPRMTFDTIADNMVSSNWVLAEYPHVYLYLVCNEAAKHMRNVDMVQATQILVDEATEQMRADAIDSRWYGRSIRIVGAQ